MKKIAIDAMGGDFAPQALVEGANQALQEFSDIELILYGDEAKIKQWEMDQAIERTKRLRPDLLK